MPRSRASSIATCGPGNVLVTEQGMLKVADFGTSRFLEIAAHGTTVIGSPPYMAPEQFQGKAVFASDIYSLGVTMYQMLTGDLPYQTPAPADLERLMRGELTTPPKLKNPKLPKAISDIVMKAMAPDITDRYPRAGDLLDAVLAARAATHGAAPVAAGRRRPRPGPPARCRTSTQRLKARETPPGAVLLELRQAAARPGRRLPVLQRSEAAQTHSQVESRHGIHRNDQVWMNGVLVAWKDATVHVASHALHYGTGIFEGIRAYKTKNGSAVYRLPEHMRRLYDSCRVYRMEPPWPLDELSRPSRDGPRQRLRRLLHPAAGLSRPRVAGARPAPLPGRRVDHRVGVGGDVRRRRPRARASTSRSARGTAWPPTRCRRWPRPPATTPTPA